VNNLVSIFANVLDGMLRLYGYIAPVASIAYLAWGAVDNQSVDIDSAAVVGVTGVVAAWWLLMSDIRRRNEGALR